MLNTCILYYYAGSRCLINFWKLCCFLSRGSYLSLSCFARDSCSFPCGNESYKSVWERRSYVSCQNFIQLFVLPVCSFWHCKCYVHAQLRVVYDIRELKQQPRRRRGQRLVKNEFIFYKRNSRWSRSVRYAGSKNVPRIHMQRWRSIPNGNTKN